MKEISNSICAHDQSIEYLPGRNFASWEPGDHFVLARPVSPPYPANLSQAMFGMGCFWGAEKKYWDLDGIYITAVGYSAGKTPFPNYKEVCSGNTGHNEVVFLVYDSEIISYSRLLKIFWLAHNPTQGMRQGNDIGTQYRSGIYTYNDAQDSEARASLTQYQTALEDAGYGAITTEICMASKFYFAEEYHQQYLAKNPQGYCGLGGLSVTYPQITG